jgi:hypothetical protein
MKNIIKKIKKSRLFSLLCILVFIGVCLGTGSLIAYIQHEADPTDVAAQYFRAFVQGNYDKMYECLNKEEGYYMDKSVYEGKMTKLRNKYSIDSYEIKEPQKKDGLYYIDVVCTGTDKKDKIFTVAVKPVRHGISIVPDYYVDISDIISKKVTITIPEGNSLMFNGTTINKDTVEVDKGENDSLVYIISGVIRGKYKISATNDAYAMNKTIKIKDKEINVDLTKIKPTASEKYSKLINKSGDKLIESFYDGVRSKNPTKKKLMKMFESNKLKKKISKLVKLSEDIVFWPEKGESSKFKIIDMNIKKLKTNISYNIEEKKYTLTYRYVYNYVTSTDTSLTNSYVYSFSGKCKSTMTIVYKVKKGKVVITDIGLKNKNKKGE